MFKQDINKTFQTTLNGGDLFPGKLSEKSRSPFLKKKNPDTEALGPFIKKNLEEDRGSVVSDTTGLLWCLACIKGVSVYLSQHAVKHKLCEVDGAEKGKIEIPLQSGDFSISRQRFPNSQNKLLLTGSSRKVFINSPFLKDLSFCQRAEAREIDRLAFSVMRTFNEGGVIKEFPEQRLAPYIQSIGSALEKDGEISSDMNRRILEHEASALLLSITQNPIMASLGFQNIGRSLRYLVTNEGATIDPLAQLIGSILYVAGNNGIDADGIMQNSKDLAEALLKQKLSLSDSPSLAK